MHHSIGLLPHAGDVANVKARVHPGSTDRSIDDTFYALNVDSITSIHTTDPRLARDYFAAIAKAAQVLVDAADVAILAEPLDLPVAVAS